MTGSVPPLRHVAIFVSALARGGAERVAVTLGNAWARRGVRVSLITTYLPARSSDYPVADGVTVVYLGALLGQGARGPLRFVRKLLAIRRWLGEHRPDVLVSFLTNVNATVICARAGSRTPLIVSERSDPAMGVDLPWSLHAARWLLYQFAEGVVVQTPEVVARLAPRMFRPPPTTVIANPLPAPLHESSARARHVGDSGIVIAVGRLSREKGYDRLIDAFARSFRDRPGWSLQIVGEGPQRKTLEELAHALDLAGRVTLPGATDDPWGAMASAQIFALSSEYEGFPNAMLEAMALGLACVAFDCHSGPAFLRGDEESAVLVPAGDVDAFAAALRALADDPCRREAMGSTAAARVRRQFSESAVLAAWESAIESVRRRSIARS